MSNHLTQLIDIITKIASMCHTHKEGAQINNPLISCQGTVIKSKFYFCLFDRRISSELLLYLDSFLIYFQKTKLRWLNPQTLCFIGLVTIGRKNFSKLLALYK